MSIYFRHEVIEPSARKVVFGLLKKGKEREGIFLPDSNQLHCIGVGRKVIDWIEVCHRFLNSCSQAYVVPKYHLFEQAVDVYKFHCWTMRLIKCQIKM